MVIIIAFYCLCDCAYFTIGTKNVKYLTSSSGNHAEL